MDQDIFDRFARRLASRRSTLAVIAALAALPTAGSTTPAASADQEGCRKPGQRCTRHRKCCPGARCAGGTCVCKQGYQRCGGRCVDLGKDPDHCGTCNTRCPQGKICTAGVCCEPGRVTCGGVCCAAAQTCVPAYDIFKALCCEVDLIFVRCPSSAIVFDPATSSSYCDLPAAEISGLEQACCPASAVCPADGLCCIDPDTREPQGCGPNGTCLLYDVSPASYTPPVKRRN